MLSESIDIASGVYLPKINVCILIFSAASLLISSHEILQCVESSIAEEQYLWHLCVFSNKSVGLFDLATILYSFLYSAVTVKPSLNYIKIVRTAISNIINKQTSILKYILPIKKLFSIINITYNER